MTAGDRLAAGEGTLTYDRVLRQAVGMFRIHWPRVAVVALVLFVPPPVLVALLDGLRRSLEADPGLIAGLGFVAGLLMVTAIRLFGPVVYAGYLDEAVGREYFHGERQRFRQVLRSLPWVRLVLADVVLIVGTMVGLALFVIPGVVFATLFALVGPVIVQERLGLVDGFRRTAELARHGWRMILVLVVGLIVLEHVLHEVAHELLHDDRLLIQVVAEWVVAAAVGGVVGLVEVALATELIARHPRRRGQAPAVRAAT